jgi:hypothetical protein
MIGTMQSRPSDRLTWDRLVLRCVDVVLRVFERDANEEL